MICLDLLDFKDILFCQVKKHWKRNEDKAENLKCNSCSPLYKNFDDIKVSFFYSRPCITRCVSARRRESDGFDARAKSCHC